MKTCGKCKTIKQLDDFYNNTKNIDGKQHRCKACSQRDHAKYIKENRQRVNKTWVEWSKTDPLINKRRNLKKTFKISYEQYCLWLGANDERCYICNEFETTIDKRSGKVRDLAVDHCHKTGKIRGLLCGGCNKGLGHFKDNPDILWTAMMYLKTNGVLPCI